jgi:hypothetical protein
VHRPEREERAGELEGVHSLGWLGGESRRLERSSRLLVVALGREEKTAAAEGERAESRVAVRRASIDRREQPLRLAKVADCKQSLDRGRARQLGEVPVQLLDVVEQLGDLPPARVAIVVRKLENSARDPQAKGGHSKPRRLDDWQQFGDLSARLLGLTSVGVDLGKNRQAKRLEHLQADLAGERYRLVAQLRGRVPGARRHLHLGVVKQAPDSVGVGALCSLGGQRSPQRARLVVAVRSAEQERKRDARRRQAHGQTDMPRRPARGRVALTFDGLLELQRTTEEVVPDNTRAREPVLRHRRERDREGRRVR